MSVGAFRKRGTDTNGPENAGFHLSFAKSAHETRTAREIRARTTCAGLSVDHVGVCRGSDFVFLFWLRDCREVVARGSFVFYLFVDFVDLGKVFLRSSFCSEFPMVTRTLAHRQLSYTEYFHQPKQHIVASNGIYFFSRRYDVAYPPPLPSRTDVRTLPANTRAGIPRCCASTCPTWTMQFKERSGWAGTWTAR